MPEAVAAFPKGAPSTAAPGAAPADRRRLLTASVTVFHLSLHGFVRSKHLCLTGSGPRRAPGRRVAPCGASNKKKLRASFTLFTTPPASPAPQRRLRLGPPCHFRSPHVKSCPRRSLNASSLRSCSYSLLRDHLTWASLRWPWARIVSFLAKQTTFACHTQREQNHDSEWGMVLTVLSGQS